MHTPNPMSHDKVKRGLDMTSRQVKDVVPFKLLGGRDDKLYERKHGLPRYTKKEMMNMTARFKNSVNALEFLPNSIVHSPKKKLHSATFKTQALGLYKVRGGWGQQATQILGSYDPGLGSVHNPKHFKSRNSIATQKAQSVAMNSALGHLELDSPSVMRQTAGSPYKTKTDKYLMASN